MSAAEVELGLPEVDVKKPDDADLVMWSVTTILQVLDKPALLYWASEQTAREAVRVARTLASRVDEDGEAEVVKWLRDARFRRDKNRLTDAQFGTEIHALCESYALTGEKPTPTRDVFGEDLAAAQGCLDQFDQWLTDFSPEYVATEVMVATPAYGIAGTCDGFLNIDGTRFIFDIKSSKKSRDAKGQATGLYPEIGLQLAAYRYAELAAVWRPRRYEKFRRRYYLLSPSEQAMAVPVPEVDAAIGIKITPEHCTAYPVRADEEVYGYFLNCLEVARFSFEASKAVIGDPLVPVTRQEVA